MRPLPNERLKERHHAFNIPTTTKFVFGVILLAACVSIGRLQPFFNGLEQTNDFTTVRTLRDKTTTTTTTFLWNNHYDPICNSRRVVYYIYPPTTVVDRTSHSLKRSSVRLEYPMQLRPILDPATNPSFIASDYDWTRYYPMGDSDDFPTMERRMWPHHEFDPFCIPMASWQSTFYPVCNEIHATADLREAIVSGQLSLLSNKGFWRHAWRFQQIPPHPRLVGDPNSTTTLAAPSSSITTTPEMTVWKTFKIHHNFEEKYYEDSRVDAVAMERLTGSPYVINMYGYCGLTVVQEFAGRELGQVVDAMTMKNNTTEKLKLARKITIGLDHIQHIPLENHGSTDRRSRPITMVHNDLNLANLVFTQDNRPVWNDFNIAILLMQHNETGARCPFYSHFPNPQWKSPEEQVEDDEESDRNPPIVNEKIDIYALGNVLYRIIVGASPWKRPEAIKLYPEEKIIVAKLKRYNGTMPTVPAHIVANATLEQDPALFALYQAMQDCYSFHPEDRPTTTELISFFDQALTLVEALEEEQRSKQHTQRDNNNNNSTSSSELLPIE